jgi:transposase
MKAYSLDLRQKIVTAHLAEKTSIRKVAAQFSVSKSLVQKQARATKNRGKFTTQDQGEAAIQFSN